jgi:hypothetical protein
MACAFQAQDILSRADYFVNKISKMYDIDESHNHIHSRHVLHYATEIMKKKPHLTQHQVLLVSLGSMLHDIIDEKYIHQSLHDQILRSAFCFILPDHESETFFTPLYLFMKNMSFSKTVHTHPKSRKLMFTLPAVMTGHPDLECYHVIRQADLLSSYNIKRTMIYRQHKSGYQKSESEIMDETVELFQNRMWKLIGSEPCVFVDDFVKDNMARVLDDASRHKLHSVSDDYDMDPDVSFSETIKDIQHIFTFAKKKSENKNDNV